MLLLSANTYMEDELARALDSPRKRWERRDTLGFRLLRLPPLFIIFAPVV